MNGLQQQLDSLGIRVQPNWLAGCLSHLQAAGNVADHQKAKLVLQQLLRSDLNECGAPALPANVQSLHDTLLPGKLLLQIDEAVNIGAAVRERYAGNDNGSRCLKLLLTDGVQQVAAAEYRHTPALHSTMAAGTKLIVQNAAVRRGILLLTPQCCAVLGGEVARLEEARQRMVTHWAQPAVGRRGAPPTMQQAMAAAAAAAWAGGPPLGARPSQQLAIQAIQGPAAVNPQLTAQRPSQQPTQALTLPQQQQHQHQHQHQRQHAQPAAPPVASQQAAASSGGGVAHRQLQQYLQPPWQAQQQQQQQPQQYMQPPGQAQQQQHHHPRATVGGASRPQPVPPSLAGAPAAPLRELDRNAAGSGRLRQSRLALPKPLPAGQDSSTAPAQQVGQAPSRSAFGQPVQQPSQQQQQQHGGPGKRPAPLSTSQDRASLPPLQRVQQGAAAPYAPSPTASALAAAGTTDDPICLSDEEQQQRPPPGGNARQEEADVDMVDAAEEAEAADGGGWQAGYDDGWGDEPPFEPGLQPWEQGFDGTDDQMCFNSDVQELGAGVGGGDQQAEAQEGGVQTVAEEEDGWQAAGEEEVDVGEQKEEEEEELGRNDAQQLAGIEQRAEAAAADGAPPSGPRGSRAAIPRSSGGQRAQQPASTVDAPAGGPGSAAACSDDDWRSDGDYEGLQQPSAAAPSSTAVAPAAAAVPSLQRQRCSGRGSLQGNVQERPPPDAAAPKSKRLANRLSGSKSEHEGCQLSPLAPGTLQRQPSPGQQEVQQAAQQQQRQQVQREALGQAVPQPPASASASAVPQLSPPDPALFCAAPSLAQVLFSSQPTPSPKAHATLASATTGSKESKVAAAGGGGRTPGCGQHLTASLQQTSTLPSLTRLHHQQQPYAHQPQRQQHLHQQPHCAGDVPAGLAEGVPSWDLLPDVTPAKQQQDAAADSSCGINGASSAEEPFISLLQLNQRTASAAPEAFPLTTTVYGKVKTLLGRMRFKDVATGKPQYGLSLAIQDGSTAVAAQMGHLFLLEFFGLAPAEFEAGLFSSDAARKQELIKLAQELQHLLSTYNGLMSVSLAAPSATLEILDLLVDLTPAQAAALQRRVKA